MVPGTLVGLELHIELWDSILDYFFINHTLRPGTLARRSPLQEQLPAGIAPFRSRFTASHQGAPFLLGKIVKRVSGEGDTIGLGPSC